MAGAPLSRRRLSEQVADHLVELIAQGDFAVGERLPSESELAHRFGVSRTSIREALRLLSASGAVESRQGGGTVVKRANVAGGLSEWSWRLVKPQEVLELLEIRVGMESEAAGLAAVRHGADDLAAMESSLQAFRAQLADPRVRGEVSDARFHQAVVAASHNPLMVRWFADVEAVYLEALAFILAPGLGDVSRRREIGADHQAILEAVADRDAERARLMVRQHLNAVMDRVRIRLSSR